MAAFSLAGCGSGVVINPGSGGTSAASGGTGSPGSGGAGATSGGAGSTSGGRNGATGGANTTSGGAGNSGGSSATSGGSGGSDTATGGGSVGGGATGGADAGTGGVGPGTGGSGGGVGPGPSNLPVPPGDSNVPKPSGTPGAVTTLHWAGYKAAVTYSFDDNNSSLISNYDKMNELGVPFTYYLWTGQSSAQNAVWKKAFDDGHEIGNHTKSHNNCDASDVKAADDFIKSTFGRKAYTLAAPNGTDCFAQAGADYVFINRDVSPSTPVLPNDNSKPMNLNCYIPATGQKASTFNGNIDDGLSKGGWVIYVVHGFTGDGSAYQPVGIQDMLDAIKYARDKGNVWVGTMEDVGAYWLGEKAITGAMKMTQGTSTTYTWTLPKNFPPGKYIRVKVDGGTLTQGGAALPWDPHGYYEVELDKLTLTVAP